MNSDDERSLPERERLAPPERGGLQASSLREKYYTPDLTDMNIHWNLPLNIHF